MENIENNSTLTNIPYLVRDINPGLEGSQPDNLINFNETLYFTTNFNDGNGNTFVELWKSDGAVSGTIKVTNIGSSANYFIDYNGSLYFVVNENELWKSDGTASGTVVVNSFDNIDNIRGMTHIYETFYFIDSSNQLWKTDVNNNAILVNTLPSKNPHWLTNVNGNLYFFTEVSEENGGLWKFDISSGNSSLIKEIKIDDANAAGVVNGTFYFTQLVDSEDSIFSDTEVWQSDGTEAGTFKVYVIKGEASPSEIPSNILTIYTEIYDNAAKVGDNLYAVGYFPNDSYGEELYAFNLGANDLDKTRDIGILGTSIQTFEDSIGNFNGSVYNVRDFYKFQVTNNSVVNLKLNGLNANANLYLYKSNGEQLSVSGLSGNNDESIILNLEAGSYYIAVQAADVGTNYKLEAQATSSGATPKDNAGNSFDNAKNIGVLSSSIQTFQDFIGNFNGLSNDTNDFYKFQLDENSAVNLKLSGLTAGANLYLYNSNNVLLNSSVLSGNSDENIIRNLLPGTYYVAVQTADNVGTNYKLEAQPTSLGATPVDNAGNNINNARDIGILGSTIQTFQDFIGNFNGLANDVSDFYKFQLDENSSVNFKLSGLNANANLYLYNSNNQVINISILSGSNDENIIRNLVPGTYYVAVQTWDGVGTNYKLEAQATSLGATPRDNAGNNINNARDIGVLGSAIQTFQDFVGNFNGLANDASDFYKFQLDENSTVNFKLSALSANANLYLYNSNNQVINSSLLSGSNDESIIRNLVPGTYYVAVQTWDGVGTNYKLEAQATSLGATPRDNAGNDINNARDIGALGSTIQTFQDFIGNFNGLANDANDFYKFKLDENSTVNFKLSGLSANTNLYLYNSNNQLLNSSVLSGSNDESIIRNLVPGTYYVAVQTWDGVGTNYKLEAQATSLGATPLDNAGNDINNARDIGVLGSTIQTFQDFIGNFNGLANDASDFYKFQLDENSTVNFKLSALSANANLYLYNNNRQLLNSSVLSGNNDESIIRNLVPGTYYVAVQTWDGVGTNYKLEAQVTSLGATPRDNAGNNLDNARDIGVLGSTIQTFQDFIGNFNGLANDANDFYKFKLDENSTVNFKLSGLNANANLYLYNSNSQVLNSSVLSGSNDESIIRNLVSGTYYVAVQTWDGVGTNYKLDAQATSLGATPRDNAGNDINNARDIGILGSTIRTFQDFIGNFNGLANDVSDFYKFQLDENSTVNFKLSGLSANANLYLYNSNSQILNSSVLSGNSDESITRNLVPGTYYVAVQTWDGAGTNYKLEAQATLLGTTPLDNAGNNLDNARDIGVLSSTVKTFEDFIGNFNGLFNDTQDFYKFKLDENSAVSLKLGNLSANANLYLYNSDGTRVLVQSINPGNIDEVITLNLKAGSYYFNVINSSNNGTNYKVEASAISLGTIPVDNAGDNLDKARDLGTLSSNGITVNDFIGNFNGLVVDQNDFYKFSVAENSTVNLKLTGLNANANLYLYNSDGKSILVQSLNPGNASEIITRDLRTGSYYFNVINSSNGNGTTYNLEATANPTQINDNNPFNNAPDIGVLSSTVITINDYLGSNNLSDYYRFSLAENSTINLKLSGLSVNYNFYLYNNDGSRQLAQSVNPGNVDEIITLNLKAGQYALQITGGNIGATSYKLEASAISLGATPQDIAGETFDKAKDLGILSATVTTVNDFIGDFNGLVRDFTDFYRFELNQNSTINLKLSDLTSNAALSLYNSDGSIRLDFSKKTQNNDEILTRNLKAGIYYVIVNGSDGKGTNYKLEANANPLDAYQDNAGDSLESARNIGILNSSQSFTDFIGNYNNLIQDNVDFYRFQIKESSSVQLSLGDFSPNTRASLQLLNGQGNLITNLTNETFNTSLFPGIYYLRVFPSSANGTNYNLTATGTPIPDFAGNSINKARDISVLSGTQIFTDFVGDIDRDDFYKFELLKDSSLNLAVSPTILGTNLTTTLLNSKGNVLDNSSSTINRNLTAGIYYAHIQGASSNDNSNYDVAFSVIPNNNNSPLQIKGITPVEGSNLGQTTISVKGSQFTSKSKVSIIDATGKEVSADKVSVQSDTSLTATFNLFGLTTGAYDVKVTDNAVTVQADDIFRVNTGNPGKLDVFISAPSAVRPWGVGEVVVTYRNGGDTNITAPLLTLSAEGALFFESGEFQNSSVQFLGINKQGDAGVLPPGATGTFSVRFRPKDNNLSNINFTVNSLATNETVNWNAIKDSSRPETIPVEAWEVIFNNFTQEVGKKAGEYEKILAENASRLSELGEYTGDVSKLLAFELQQVNSQGIFERFNLGSFGRGWNNPWDISVKADNKGNITIQNGGSLRFFTKQANGSFKGEDNDNATLTKLGDAYRLREQSGTVLAFASDGKLDFIQDTNSNKVTANYTSAKLTTLTYSNGDVITFAYNNAGKISEITDQFGQKTTYTYDVTGEKLLSVSDISGTISYTYEKSGAKANAIKSITFPDGTQTLFDYDDKGRLIKESRNGGAETVTYSYDSAGGVTVTDASGQSRILQNASGQISQIKDALGRVTEFRYDNTGNLTRIMAPGNNLSSFNYDTRGNLLSTTDPLGQRIEFTYNSQFNQIQSVRDQRGNSIYYNYDNKGNLSDITYADGSKETYSYNNKGEVTISVNRRGQDIDYTYDTRGQLTKKVFADGSEATFEYDSRGNLTKATDADSSVTYAYDGADRLTKVSYGTQRSLEFTYDAGGRRTKMVDQDGFTTNYSYDEVGRLKQLTDKNGANIITYSYDNVGQLTREDNGNGTYTNYSYDAAGQLLNIINYKADNSINSRFDYTYDELGRRTSMTTLSGKTSYDYDATGQLTSVTLEDGRVIAYKYDAAGNRISVTDSGATTTYNTNNLNQYTNVGGANYTYDKDGNLISKTQGSQTWTYSYDIENRLIGVVAPSGTWKYEYDALGNRIASIQNGQRTEYLLDPTGLGDVVGEYSSSNVARYTHGLGLVSRVDGSNTASYYDADAIGSVIGLTGASSDYLNRYSYLPFGEDLSKTETVTNPFEYVGQWGVMDEGNSLDFMRARFYAPGDGRFISDDPIGLLGGDTNLKRYVSNNPVIFQDPTGLAYFKKKSLVGNKYYYEPLGDLNNSELAHEHIVFDKPQVIPGYNNNQPIDNIGFGPGASNPSPFGPGKLFHYDKDKKNEKAEHDKLVEDITSKHFDDKDIVEAIKRTKTKYYNVIPWDAFGDNCQEWIERIKDEYNKIKQEKEKTKASTSIATSFDPNDIIGPSGYGAQNWLTPNQVLPYTIRFENQATATAPAVFVTITQQLDPDFDLSTFELGDFGFGSIYIDVPDGFQSYNTRVDLRDTIGDFVDFDASLDSSTGKVTWKLTTIDPNTGEMPDDVDAGFLPPNNANHDGEGFVNYKVTAKSTSITGTRIDAEARIVFDTNEPIDTPPIFNTIDIGKPSSNITTLPTVVPKNFQVSWGGSDDGSGIVSYDIYVAIDNGEFKLWLDDTKTTSAIYTGEGSKIYSFYSVAKDGVGYTEETPVTADTTVRVNNAPTLERAILDQNATENIAFNYILPEGAFKDVDNNDTLTYIAILENGAALPSWLNFNSITRSFSGTPTNSDVGSINIKLVAADNIGETASDIFGINIKDTPDKAPTLSKNSNNIFSISGGNGKPKLSITLSGNNSNLVNELGVFVVDNEQGAINGIAPGIEGYAKAALERSKVIFSTIPNSPNGFNQSNLTRLVEFNSGAKLGFFLVRNSTIDTVLSGITPMSEVLFSQPSTQKIELIEDGQYSIFWEDGKVNSNLDFQDLVIQAQASSKTLPIGTKLQVNSQAELIDLRDITGQVNGEFIVNREAAFDNFVGFYKVTDANGSIDFNGDGIVDIRPGDIGYTQAALQGRVKGLDMTVANQGTANFTTNLDGGSIYAPFIIANSKPEALLDNNPNNNPDVYFAFSGANPGKFDHIRLLGHNTWGFEDLPLGGDMDYNDVVMRANFKTI